MGSDTGFIEAVVPLILRADMPLNAVARIGEIITLDARLRSYGGGLGHADSFEELGANFDKYERLLQKLQNGMTIFLREGDKLGFIELLSIVKDELSAF
jgi:hypothetical protein